MEDTKSNQNETPGDATTEAKKRAAAAAVAVALALQPRARRQALPQPPDSAWLVTTRAIQLNQSIQKIRGTRGRDR